MKNIRSFAFSFVIIALLLPSILLGEDLNDLAYEDRIHLGAATIWNPEGNGDCLLFPYYDVRNVDGKRQISNINIENFGEYGIVAKLRFREWARGKEIFSKDIWIPSKGNWNAKIEMSEDGTNAIITSPWNVIWRSDSKTFYFTNPLMTGVPFSTKNVRRGLGESTLFGYVEVIGEEKTGPANLGGKTGRLSGYERDCPNTLRGTLSITRVEDGAVMAYDAVAIGNFSRNQGSLFRSPGSPYPRLDTSEDTLDQLEFQLSKYDVFGPFSVTPSNQGKTSLIITYPTKFFHYSNGKRLNQNNNPFKGPVESQGETLKSSLAQNGSPLPADSEITLPYAVNVIGLYLGTESSPTGIDNLSLPIFSYESGEVKLTSGNMAQRTLIDDYEYFREMFTTYRGLPALGLVLREYRNPDVLHASIIPADFSAVWEDTAIESILFPTFVSGPDFGIVNTGYTFETGGASSTIGDPIQYQFDWGDGSPVTDDTWLAAGVTSATHSYAAGGIYAIQSRARCSLHTDLVSKWSKAFLIRIESVSSPSILSGPTTGIPNVSYTYTASGALSSLGHPLEYQFDWIGDATDVSQWGPSVQSKTWSVGGVYTVRVRTRCKIDTFIVSDWSSGLTVTIELISQPSTPTGTSLGNGGVDYSFSTAGSISNLGDPLEYQFDWGDGTFSSWGLPTQSRSWSQYGTFTIKVKARCKIHPSVESDWSDGFDFSIETISVPSMPSGPTVITTGVSYSYTTSGSVSSSGHPIEYQFDWGTGLLSPWGGLTQSHLWSNPGSYTVKVRARCQLNPTLVTDWSPGLTVATESVSAPAVPTGPTSGSIGEIYSYLTGGAFSDNGDPIEYQFDWGDGSTSGWLPIGTLSAGKAWTDPGTYIVKAQARCSIHTDIISNWSPGIGVTISTLPPSGDTILIPSPPTGPTYGTKGTSYSYTTSGAISTLGHPVEYQFDWGNGTFSTWDGASQSNIWSTSGFYTVRVRARCQLHPTLVTDWSAGLQVGIEFVSTPSTPTGSTSGTVGEGYNYSTGGSSSDLGPNHPIQYQFDWGDGSTSEWLPVGITSVGKAWIDPGTYIVMAHARCEIHGIVSSWSQGILVTINPGPPPEAERISTPFIETVGARGSIHEVPNNLISGRKDILYSFGYSPGISNLGHTTEHQFDWGDGTFSLWGDSDKAWSTSGDYLVKVIARDVENPTVKSEWSSGLDVIIDYITPPNTPVWVAGPSDGIGYVTPPAPGYYTFSTGGSTSEIGQPLQYRFNWGDGTDSGWLPPGTLIANHVWTVQGTYIVRAEARGWWYLGADGSTEHFSDYSQNLSVTIRPTEVVSPPSIVSGPNIGFPNAFPPYTYSAGAAVSSLGHPVQYFFDWGDGTDSNWLPVGTTSASKSWPNGGTYNVRVRARCATDSNVLSAWSTVLTVKIELISAPNTPVGPNTGLPGVSYSYMTGGATSNIGDTVEYQFDWGDGTFSPWQLAPSAAKTWSVGEAYSVRARARCVTHPDVMSQWSTALTVNIEKISTPTKPVGPIIGIPFSLNTYTSGGATSNTLDPVEYQFDWGDGSFSDWMSPDAQGAISAAHSWQFGGIFSVRVKARCAIHQSIESAASDPLEVSIETITAPNKPTLAGSPPPDPPFNANVDFTFEVGGSVSNIDHAIEYQFIWGDGTQSTWITPDAGGIASASHRWTTTATFSIRVWARCKQHPLAHSSVSPFLNFKIE